MWDPTIGTAYPSSFLPASLVPLWQSFGSPRQATWLAADLASVAASSMIDWCGLTSLRLVGHNASSVAQEEADREMRIREEEGEEAEEEAVIGELLARIL